MKKSTVGELAALVGAKVYGDASWEIHDGCALDSAGSHDVTFAESERNLRKVPQCEAGCVVIKTDAVAARRDDWNPKTLLAVDDPMSAFVRILQHLRPPRLRSTIGISAAAQVDESAVVGEGTNIHPTAVLGEDVVIGDRCEIHPGVVIGPGCRIGDDVVLHPHVVLYADITIADRVTIHASAVIGADGFGYRLIDGKRKRVPHLGSVRIESDVEIGACTTIDRSMIGETIIGEGSKIDNLVMIAHNCELGRHNAIVGQVGFAGSVTTGDYVVVAGHVGVADHVHLGERCVIGSKSGVHKDVPSGETYIGQPAVPAAEAMRVAMAQKRLPEALKSLKQLSKQVDELKQQLDEQSGSDRDTQRPAA